MQHIGIDLAWGLKQPTGLAVLDDAGRLVHVSAVRTDEQIETALAPFTAGPCIVAIDAPLVVMNATGNRAAERALNADFARFQAGAHPTNTGKPEFTTVTPTAGGSAGACGWTSTPARDATAGRSRSTRMRPRWRCSGWAAR